MEQATGFYLNIYGRDCDIFVIFNEPNDQPTNEEISVIASIVEKAIDEGTIQDTALASFRRELQQEIEKTNLNCVQYGVQVILAM